MEKTNRGFSYLEFTDSNGIKCSLQKSSAAMQDHIWLGIDKPKLTVFENVSCGKYIIADMPEQFQVNARMHLTQKQVAELLPHLQRFVETGEI